MTWRLVQAALIALVLIMAPGVRAETIRIATFNVELKRKGPGVALRDILSGDDPQVAAIVEVVGRVAPDILALQGLDWDLDGMALAALADALRADGVEYPHAYTAQPNSGLETGVDLDGDGRSHRAADAQGYGLFTGQGGMAILSRYPVLRDQVQDFTPMLWADLPGHIMPVTPTGAPFPSARAQAVQRLSSVGHWVVPLRLPDGRALTLLTYHAGPPVFDGSEDRNGRRNHDETRFWSLFLAGEIGTPPPGLFVVAGTATLDPEDSEGRRSAITTLLRNPRLQDPRPASIGGALGPDQGHRGDNALDTVDWPAPGPGRLRVDYILPSIDWQVAASGVFWPEPGTEGHDAALGASRHRLVWVDLIAPAP